MKAHLALRCPTVMNRAKLEYLYIISSETNKNTFKQTIQDQQNDRNNNSRTVTDIVRSNRALVRFFICCGIPFSVADSPFFWNFVKTLCYHYNPPRRTALSTTYLDTEAASITLKWKKNYIY
jgi:hypothetical protein